MVDHTLDPIRVKFMTPEQAEHHMLLVKGKQEAEKKRLEKIAFEANVKKQVEADRRQKDTEPVTDLKGNKINFGANTVIFKAPEQKKGG